MASTGPSLRGYALPIIAFLLMSFVLLAQAQMPPAPAPSNDSSTVDQGIAYILMLLALAVTYLLH